MAGISLVKKYPALSTFLTLEFVLLIIVSYQIQVSPRLSLLEKFGLFFFAPLQEFGHATLGSFSKAMDEKKTLEVLRLENQQLRRELAGFAGVKTQLVETELENQRFRELLELPAEERWTYTHAEVIGHSQRRNDFMITINKGTNHGVRAELGVFCSQGIVGIVWEASGGYAKIMTANNPHAVIAAMVQSSRYMESFVSGKGYRKGSMLTSRLGRLENFPNFEKIYPNDLIMTSGFDGIFPKGLHIGRVSHGEVSSYGFQNVEITFTTDFARLEEVVVLVPICREDHHELE